MKITYIIILIMVVLFISGCTPVATIPSDYVDHTDNAIRTISSTHSMIHQGKHFKYENFFLLPTGTTKYYAIYTNNTEYHFNYYFSFEYGEGEFDIYEGANLSNVGTKLLSYNSNRNSNLTSVGFLYDNPTITTYGTKLFSIRLGQRRESGEISRADNEIILKKNTYYLLKFINYNTNQNIVDLRLIGYEN